eukprot:1158920-Pelagomonas_calceolata.AAC.15
MFYMQQAKRVKLPIPGLIASFASRTGAQLHDCRSHCIAAAIHVIAQAMGSMLPPNCRSRVIAAAI